MWFRKVRGSLDLALRCVRDPQLESTCCGGLSSALPLPLACLLGALAALPVGPVLVVLKYIGSFGKTVFFPRDLMGLFLVLLGTGALYVLLTRWLPLRFQRFRLVDAVLVALLILVWWWAGTTAASQAVTELYRLLTILVVPMLFWIYRRSLHWFLALGGLWDRPGMVAELVRYHLALRFGLPRLGLVSARWEDGVLIVAGPFDPSDEKRTVDLVKREIPYELNLQVESTLSAEEYARRSVPALSPVRREGSTRASIWQVVGLVALVYLFLVGAAYFSAGREGSWMELDIGDMFAHPFLAATLREADPRNASVDSILKWLLVDRDFDRIYQWHLHPRLKVQWEEGDFRFFARNFVETQYRYVDRIGIIGERELEEWRHPRTNEVYRQVIQVEVELRNTQRDSFGRVLQSDTQIVSFYFQRLEEIWCLIL